jgi:hypothetical protein
MIQGEPGYVKMAILRAQTVRLVKIPGSRPIIYINDVKHVILKVNDIDIVSAHAVRFDVGEEDDLSDAVIVQGTREDVAGWIENVREVAIIGATRGNVIVEAIGRLKPGKGLVSMPLYPFLTATPFDEEWATIRLPVVDNGKTVYDRLIFMRTIATVLPGIRLRLSGLAVRALLPGGWTPKHKEVLLNLGAKSVFTDAKPPRTGFHAESAPVSVFTEAQQAIDAEKTEATKMIADMRATGSDARILSGPTSGDYMERRLRSVGGKLGDIAKVFAKVGWAVVKVTNQNVPPDEVVEVAGLALSTTAPF